MNKIEVAAFIESKKEQMSQIFDGIWELRGSSEVIEAYFKRMYNADILLEELKKVEEILCHAEEVELVRLAELRLHFKYAVAINDFFDGEFCKVANLVSDKGESYWVLYLASDRAL